MTAAYFTLLLRAPFWMAFIPGVLLAHRIGVMLHEYIHGIPFRRYRDCHAVVTLFDGLLLMFGFLELFRGTHLSHHAWLNREGDSGYQQARKPPPAYRGAAWLAALEISQHLGFFWQSLHGAHPFVRGRRMLLGMIGSSLMAAFWWLAGRPDIVWKIIVIAAFTTAFPISLRGAIEHHSHPGDPGFANEYRVLIPLFNLNRHIHHHEEPRCPWYQLKYRHPAPLGEWDYFTYWYRVYVRKDLVLMQPMNENLPSLPDDPTLARPTHEGERP